MLNNIYWSGAGGGHFPYKHLIENQLKMLRKVKGSGLENEFLCEQDINFKALHCVE